LVIIPGRTVPRKIRANENGENQSVYRQDGMGKIFKKLTERFMGDYYEGK
jgi:hypothetical protein